MRRNATVVAILFIVGVLVSVGAAQKTKLKTTAPLWTTTEFTNLLSANDVFARTGGQVQPPAQEETTVIMQIVGTVALIEDRSPMMLVLPTVPHDGEEKHVPYVAWHPIQELSRAREDWVQLEDQYGDLSPWRFFVLNREEIVIDNDLTGNQPISITRSGTCDRFQPDFSCVPRARDFVGAGATVNPAFLAPNPDKAVRAVMNIERGILQPEIRDTCEWEFTNANVTRRQKAAGVISYIFKITGTELRLNSKKLDGNREETELVRIRATRQDPIIHVRIGNSPGAFPVRPREVNPDHHFDAYYQFLLGNDGNPIPPELRALPNRVKTSCAASTRPSITCGPGTI